MPPILPQEKYFKRCKGCLNHKAAEHHWHERSIYCKYRLVSPGGHTCPGCTQNKSIGHDSHKYDDTCRWTIGQGRFSRAHRTGHHPRAPAIPLHDIPVGDAQAQLPGERDLGAVDEAEALQRDKDRWKEERRKADEDTRGESTPPAGPVPAPATPPELKEGEVPPPPDAVVPYRHRRAGARGTTDIVEHRKHFSQVTGQDLMCRRPCVR